MVLFKHRAIKAQHFYLDEETKEINPAFLDISEEWTVFTLKQESKDKDLQDITKDDIEKIERYISGNPLSSVSAEDFNEIIDLIPKDIRDLTDEDDLLGSDNVQSDWEEEDIESDAYILNKPDLTIYAELKDLLLKKLHNLTSITDKTELDEIEDILIGLNLKETLLKVRKYRMTDPEILLPERYELATDTDFELYNSNRFRYIGTKPYIIIPKEVQGQILTTTLLEDSQNNKEGMFSANTYIKGIALANDSEITSFEEAFRDNIQNELELIYLNTSNITIFKCMFHNSAATTLDLSSFDTSQATTMSMMFRDAQVVHLDLSSFNTSKVWDMTDMFNNANIEKLDVRHFDTSKVTTMLQMFRYADVTELDLRSFDTSKVKNMYGMFQGAIIPKLRLCSFDTSAVTNMQSMFSGSQIIDLEGNCTRTQVDADNFNNSTGKPEELHFIVKKPTVYSLQEEVDNAKERESVLRFYIDDEGDLAYEIRESE